MLPHPGSRSFRKLRTEAIGPRASQRSVAKIYGPPDETLAIGPAEAWYYYREGIAFLFVEREISEIHEIRPPRAVP